MAETVEAPCLSAANVRHTDSTRNTKAYPQLSVLDGATVLLRKSCSFGADSTLAALPNAELWTGSICLKQGVVKYLETLTATREAPRVVSRLVLIIARALRLCEVLAPLSWLFPVSQLRCTPAYHATKIFAHLQTFSSKVYSYQHIRNDSRILCMCASQCHSVLGTS